MRDLRKTLFAEDQDIRKAATGRQDENNRNHVSCHLAGLSDSTRDQFVMLQRKVSWIKLLIHIKISMKMRYGIFNIKFTDDQHGWMVWRH